MANKKLLIITNSAPPYVCGVSDYSFKVAETLASRYKQIVIGLQILPSYPCISQFEIRRWASALESVFEADEGFDVLLNYAPTIYSKAGYPLSLIRALSRLKSSAKADHRLFVQVHETWHGGRLPFKHAVRDCVCRRALQKICSLANGVCAMTEVQKNKIELHFGLENLPLIHVGSNVLPAQSDLGLHGIRDLRSWVVFGLAHTRLWSFEANLSVLKELYNDGKIRRLTAIGPVGNLYADREAKLALENFGPGFLHQCGVLPGEQVSQMLLNAGAAIVGQNVDSLKKSGSFAALAAHGLPIICDVPATLLDPPGAAIIRPSELLDNPSLLEGEDAQARRRFLHTWFWSTRSWEAIGDQIWEWMESGRK